VAHSLLVVFYHLLNNKQLDYRELGGSYFDTLDPSRLRRHLVKRLESLGYEVTLAERNAAYRARRRALIIQSFGGDTTTYRTCRG